MVLVEVDVGAESFVVRIPARNLSRSWRDSVTVRDGRVVVGIGEELDDGETAPAQETHSHVITRPALARQMFDPALAAAMITYGFVRTARDAGLGLQIGLLGVHLRLRHPGWREIPATDRRRFLELCRLSRVDVNGAVVVGPRVDIPIIRTLVGRRRISPDGE